MKLFSELAKEVIEPGLCCCCGSCILFCRQSGFDALAVGAKGQPLLARPGRCVQCGLCYMICPQTHVLDDEIMKRSEWTEPMGRVLETFVVRPVGDPSLSPSSGPGVAFGVIRAMLVHLLERRQIDLVIMARQGGGLFRAGSPEQISAQAELMFARDEGGGPRPVSSLKDMVQALNDAQRTALVGPPCVIKSIRKMQVLNLVPSHAVNFCFGLFCSAGPLETACRFCADFSSQFADISVGRTGARPGWATLMIRTIAGRRVLAGCLSAPRVFQMDGPLPFYPNAPAGNVVLEQIFVQSDPGVSTRALFAVRKASSAKKKKARYNLRTMKQRPTTLGI